MALSVESNNQLMMSEIAIAGHERNQVGQSKSDYCFSIWLGDIISVKSDRDLVYIRHNFQWTVLFKVINTLE